MYVDAMACGEGCRVLTPAPSISPHRSSRMATRRATPAALPITYYDRPAPVSRTNVAALPALAKPRKATVFRAGRHAAGSPTDRDGGATANAAPGTTDPFSQIKHLRMASEAEPRQELRRQQGGMLAGGAIDLHEIAGAEIPDPCGFRDLRSVGR